MIGNGFVAPEILQDKAMVRGSLFCTRVWILVGDIVSHRFDFSVIGYDCGVFTCMFADFLSKDCPLMFTQHHVDQCRQRIALSIMSGQAIL